MGAGAIEGYDGGVVMITHNNEFCSKLCPETWVMDAGHLETKGDAEWMLKQDTKIDQNQAITEVTDAAGNVTTLTTPESRRQTNSCKIVQTIRSTPSAGRSIRRCVE